MVEVKSSSPEVRTAVLRGDYDGRLGEVDAFLSVREIEAAITALRQVKRAALQCAIDGNARSSAGTDDVSDAADHLRASYLLRELGHQKLKETLAALRLFEKLLPQAKKAEQAQAAAGEATRGIPYMADTFYALGLDGEQLKAAIRADVANGSPSAWAGNNDGMATHDEIRSGAASLLRTDEAVALRAKLSPKVDSNTTSVRIRK